MNRTIIMDILSRKNVYKYYKEYLETQWYNSAQIKEYQIRKLKSLLTHCYINVPYYSRIMRNSNLNPEKIDSLNVLDNFPILTKEIIQENYEDIIPINIKHIRGVKTGQTGGTTGNILFNKNDSNTRSSVWGSYKRYEDWMGLKPNDKILILMGGHVLHDSFIEKFRKGLINLIENSTNFDIYNTTDTNIEEVINTLKNGKFAHIRSYPQYLFSLSKKLKEQGLKFNIKAISTTAESVMPHHREIFKNVFNSEVFDQYGCGEIGGIAYECDHHNGLHITEERVYVELNNQQELIITDLDNYSMPFIKYWNADQAIMSSNLCNCGRQLKLIKQILGRTCDYVIGLNNEYLHWAYFWHLFFDSNIAHNRNLKKFQIVQRSNKSMNIKLVCDELSLDEKNILISDIQKRLGRIDIIFTFHNEIENSVSGKYRPVLNELVK